MKNKLLLELVITLATLISQVFNAGGTAFDSTERLQQLREQMKKYGFAAYIVPTTDAHQSEYLPEHDKRRQFISGFTGSDGDAVITMDKAALWTDSRYFIQGAEQLDSNWELMKEGTPGVLSIGDWLASVLQEGDKVGTDPRLLTLISWKAYERALDAAGVELAFITDNLIDNIWTENEGREPHKMDAITVLDEKFTGRSWQDKLQEIRSRFQRYKEYVAVFSELDDIAYLLNMRGNDVNYTPVFRGFVIVTIKETFLYVAPEKVTDEVKEHLKSDSPEGVQIKDYDDVWDDYEELSKEVADSGGKIILASPYSYQKGISYYFYKKAPAGKIVLRPSVILGMKDVKNEVEAAGIRKAQIRDAVAICQMLHTLEKEIPEGKYWDEMGVVKAVQEFRSKQENNRGSSYAPISAFGVHSALPHYVPTEETNIAIDTSGMYMLDSGGQYLDGTTDITRSTHFGTPTQEMIDIYTALLMGCIDWVTNIFKKGERELSLDILIRRPLFRLGYDYGHGSGHGIGMYLSVHESTNYTFHEGYFGASEPGYYRENEFGMRLENEVTCLKSNVSTPENEFLTFEPVTFVPYEKKLINPELMDFRQLEWLNNYHAQVLTLVGGELKKQGLDDVYDWLVKKTEPIGV